MFRSLVTRIPKSLCSVKSKNSVPCSGSIRSMNDTSSSSSDDEQSTTLENVDTMKCINRVTLLGRAIGPAMALNMSNTEMASFTLATNEIRRNRNEELVKRSEFHRVQVFIPRLVQKTRHVVQKGSRILVEGKINYNVRKNDNGTVSHFTNIIAENIIFITGLREDRNDQDLDHSFDEDRVETEVKQ